MLKTHDGRDIWRRGGRVEKLDLQVGSEDTAEGALAVAAEKLRSSAAFLRDASEKYAKNAEAKEKQASEIEAAIRKLEGK